MQFQSRSSDDVYRYISLIVLFGNSETKEHLTSNMDSDADHMYVSMVNQAGLGMFQYVLSQGAAWSGVL